MAANTRSAKLTIQEVRTHAKDSVDNDSGSDTEIGRHARPIVDSSVNGIGARGHVITQGALLTNDSPTGLPTPPLTPGSTKTGQSLIDNDLSGLSNPLRIESDMSGRILPPGMKLRFHVPKPIMLRIPGRTLTPGLKLNFKVQKAVGASKQRRLRLIVKQEERFSKTSTDALLNNLAIKHPYTWGTAVHPMSINDLLAQGFFRKLPSFTATEYPSKLVNFVPMEIGNNRILNRRSEVDIGRLQNQAREALDCLCE